MENRQIFYDMKELNYFILIAFLDLIVLFFSSNYFLRIQDKWKRIYAKTPSGYNLFLGVLLPTVFTIIIIIPSAAVPIYFLHFLKLDIHELWAIVPLAIILIYWLIYKSEEVSKVYSKVDKRKL